MARMHTYRRVLTASLLAATIAAGGIAGVVGMPPAGAAEAPTRIMFLGDSITGSPGCWRAILWNRLRANGYTNIDSVGTQPAQGCSLPYDGDNEGHGGALATSVADQNQLVGWLSAAKPDIVVMHFGTNDIWSNRATGVILDAYSRLVDQMRASNPAMKILVAKIIPVNPATCGACAARTVALNDAIPAWAAARTTSRSPIVVVDQWTGFRDATDTTDGVHPNDAGNAKIADRWYAPLAAALSATTPGGTATPIAPATPTVTPTRSATPTPTVTPTRSATPTPTASAPASPPPTSAPVTQPPGTAACRAAYRVIGQWPGGFQGEVTVTNTGAFAIAGWTVAFRFANGQQVSQSWNAGLTQAGADVTVKPVTWNAQLSAGATATFGFIGTWNGTNAAPAVTCAAHTSLG